MSILKLESYPDIGIRKKIIISFSAIVILCNYYYFHFYDFSQGVSSAPTYFSLSKVLGVALLTVSIFRFKVKSFMSPRMVSFAIFLIFSSVFVFLKRAHLDLGSDLYLNMIVCALPFLLLKMDENVRSILFFFEASLWVLVLQIGLDIFIRLNGYSLWENKSFVGGLGNPSSFGMLCNIALSYVLFLRRSSFFSIIFLVFIVFGVAGTKSLFSIASMILVFSYYFWQKNKFAWFLMLLLFCIILLFFGEYFLSGHFGYKFDSLFSLISSGNVEGSRSITARVEIHKTFFEELSDSFFKVVLFGYDNVYYYSADSQFLTYFGSFGVLVSLLFFIPIFYHLASIKRIDGFARFIWVSFLLFSIMFLFNRVVDYYPMPLFFLLLFFVDLDKVRYPK